MWKPLSAVILSAAFVLPCVMLAEQQQRGPSTAEERARAIRAAHQIESDPLSPQSLAERQWMTIWLIEIPDITVKICSEYLKPLLNAKKNYSSEIFSQSMLSAAAFILENPDKAKDDIAVQTAGLEGALKAYEAILKAKPKARWAFLDELLAKREKGELQNYVRDKAQGCKN